MSKEETELKSKKKKKKGKVSTTDKINWVFNILNFAGVVAALWISIWNINSSESIAQRSGAFDKGQLALSFGGYFVAPNVPFDVYYGTNFLDSTLHFATLPIGVHNQGEKTVENAAMLLKYPHVAHIAIDDKLIEYNTSSIDQIERKFITVEPYDQISYKFNSINPDFSIAAGDLICLRKETIGSHTFPVTTKDSSIIKLSTTYSYGYPLTITLAGKDIRTQQYNFVINYRGENNLGKLVKAVVSEKLGAKNKQNIIDKFFVIIPKTEKVIGDKNHRMTFMNSDANTTLFCQFDKEMKFLTVFNQDGTIQKQYDLTKSE